MVVQVDNTKFRRDLIFKDQIVGLCLDPNAGLLFFSTVGRPAKIYRTFLDGSNVTAIVERGLSLPYALTCDYSGRKLFWVDVGFLKIQYSDYNGNALGTLLGAGLGAPVSIAVYKHNVFFVDARLASVFKTSKFYSVTPVALKSNLNNLNQVKVYAADYQAQTDNHPCARQNGDCSHFCFTVPSPDPQYRISRHCGCPYGMRLDQNGMSCVQNASERVSNTCQAPYFFKCSNDRCIRRLDVCDGVNDCLDFSDEQNCPSN